MEREASPWALEPRDVQSPDAMGSPEGSPKGEGGNALRGAGERGAAVVGRGEKRAGRIGGALLGRGGEGISAPAQGQRPCSRRRLVTA